MTTRPTCFIDLHLHLDGSLSLANARELAALEGIALPDQDQELQKLLMVSDGCRDLNEYLEKFTLPCSLMQSEQTIEAATYHLCCELAQKGFLYAEIRFAPQKHCLKGLTQEQVVQSAIGGLQRSGFHGQLILCCMRDGADNSAENMETVLLTKKYLHQGVCACDLAGAEALFPNEKYAHIFEYARMLSVPFTIHSGEALGPESISLALDYGAQRIGHGIRSIEDPAVVRRLADNRIALEVCPTSNINTCVFEHIKQMPIPQLMDAGVLITINSDNMSVSNTDVPQELQHLTDAFGYDYKQWKAFLLNAANAAFLSDSDKQQLINRIEDII